MKDSNPVVQKSKAFAIRIIRLYQHLTAEKKEFILSKQVLRSGTSIGANVRESIRAQSTADFLAKMQISLILQPLVQVLKQQSPPWSLIQKLMKRTPSLIHA